MLRSIRVGAVELVPVAGAPAGRYASSPEACGLAEDDAGAWELDAAAPGVHRVLLCWAGPAGAGEASVTRGLLGVEAGSPLTADVARRAGAQGAIFAWPRTQAGRAEVQGRRVQEGAVAPGMRVALRPLSGPFVLRADGTRAAPGPTLLRLGSEGIGLGSEPPADSP